MFDLNTVIGLTEELKTEIKNLDFLQIRSSEVVVALNQLVNRVTTELEPGEARDLAVLLEEFIMKYNAEFKKEAPLELVNYKNMVAQLKCTGFTLLPADEAEEILEHRTVFSFRKGINVKGEVYSRLSFLEDGLTKGQERKKFIQVFSRNQEKIGTQTIEIKGDPRSVAPTVQNWLHDYDRYFEPGVLKGGFEEAIYLSKSPNISKLSQEDKELLLNILKLYNFLRYPAMQADVGVPGVTPLIRRPASVSHDTVTVPAQIFTQQIKRAYEQKGGVLDKVAGVEEEVRELYKSDPKSAHELIANLVSPPAPTSSRPPIEKVLAVLVILSEEGKLGELLTGDPRLLTEFKKYLKEKNKSDALHNLELNPRSPTNTGPFLRFVMEERGGMEPGLAARFAVRLANLMRKAGKKEYMDMAYFDIESGQFRWKT